jgi:hypothetical protein
MLMDGIFLAPTGGKGVMCLSRRGSKPFVHVTCLDHFRQIRGGRSHAYYK